MPSGPSATREDALKATKSVRFACDKILEYLLRDINISDLFLLGSRQECNRYVIFLANTLDTRFYHLSIAPSRGPGGKLYFKATDQIVKPSEEELKERQSLCIFLSYFYIRILQILGALMLTLIDDANVMVKMEATKDLQQSYRSQESRSYQAPLGAPGGPRPGPDGYTGPIRQYGEDGRRPVAWTPQSDQRRMPRQEERSRYFGGAVYTEAQLGSFAFLKNALSDTRDGKEGREEIRAAYRGQPTFVDTGYGLTKNSGVSFRVSSGSSLRDSEKNVGYLYFATPRHNEIPLFEVILRSSPKTSNKYELSLEGVRYKELIDRRGVDISEKDCDRIMYDVFSSPMVMAYYEGGEAKVQLTDGKVITFKSFVEELKSVFMKVLRLKSDSRVQDTRTGSDRYDTGKGYGTGYVKGYGSAYGSTDGRRESLSQGIERTERQAEPALKLQKTLVALNQTRPVAHCVARALQLLGAKTSVSEFESAICDTKFHLTSEGRDKEVERSALPGIGGELGKSPGIRVLAQLFYDFVQIRSSQITRTDSQAAVKEYLGFMKSMLEVFSTKNPQEIDEELKDKILQKKPEEDNEITKLSDNKSAEKCDALNRTGLDAKYKVGTPLASQVMGAVKKLFGAQIRHAGECGRILNMLFLIKQGGETMTVRIHPALFTKGFPELDRINGLARQLLVRYYSNCEAIYKAGMDIIVSSKTAEKDAADKLEQQKQQAQQAQQQAQQQPGQQQPQQQQQQPQNKPLIGRTNQSQSIAQPQVRIRGGRKTRKAIRTTSQTS